MIKVGDKVRLKSWSLLGGGFYNVVRIDNGYAFLKEGLHEYPYSVAGNEWEIEGAEPCTTAPFKPGDKVKRKDGELFSNGSLIVTVDKISCNNHIWFKETKTWSHFDYLTFVSAGDTFPPLPWSREGGKIEPFRTVTKRELKPGRYGRVRISDSFQIRVEAVTDAEQLDEVMHTLAQIREVLSDV